MSNLAIVHHQGGQATSDPQQPGTVAIRSPGGGERRLVARFGQEVLASGYTVTPNLVLRYASRLGINTGELLLVQYIWQHWWDSHRPHPSVSTLAREMGKSPRMVRYYLHGLREKGLLALEERRGRAGEQLANSYDFTPLLHAVLAVAQQEGDCGHEHAGSILQSPSANRCAGPMQAVAANEDTGTTGTPSRDQYDTIRAHGHERPATHREGAQGKGSQGLLCSGETPAAGPTEPDAAGGPLDATLPGPAGTPAQALLAPIAEIGEEFGDQSHPRVSACRAANLFARTGLSLADYLDLIGQARAIARTNRHRVTTLGTSATALPRRNLMPYFFATLEDLAGATLRTQCTTADLPPAPAEHADGAPAASAAQVTWRAALDELRGVLMPETYRHWLAPTRALQVDGQTLLVLAPSDFHRQWLTMRMGARVAEALARSGAPTMRVVYAIPGEAEH